MKTLLEKIGSKIIVLTLSEMEVSRLNKYLDRKYSNIGYWGQEQQNHNCLWVWVLDHKASSPVTGSSGSHTLEYTITKYPEVRIYNMKQFDELVLHVSFLI